MAQWWSCDTKIVHSTWRSKGKDRGIQATKTLIGQSDSKQVCSPPRQCSLLKSTVYQNFLSQLPYYWPIRLKFRQWDEPVIAILTITKSLQLCWRPYAPIVTSFIPFLVVRIHGSCPWSEHTKFCYVMPSCPAFPVSANFVDLLSLIRMRTSCLFDLLEPAMSSKALERRY